ncbi:hypothetical protein Pla52n_00070 [Stieleria varia]|uniref:Uncharacterized protein n=1 Tax=Stieleria varia TaxID=2528005 RepID=A0A5C6BAA2_9BACT|nr:hypothetical protein Pla52n_00070 [Stieleria varia]
MTSFGKNHENTGHLSNNVTDQLTGRSDLSRLSAFERLGQHQITEFDHFVIFSLNQMVGCDVAVNHFLAVGAVKQSAAR